MSRRPAPPPPTSAEDVIVHLLVQHEINHRALEQHERVLNTDELMPDDHAFSVVLDWLGFPRNQEDVFCRDWLGDSWYERISSNCPAESLAAGIREWLQAFRIEAARKGWETWNKEDDR